MSLSDSTKLKPTYFRLTRGKIHDGILALPQRILSMLLRSTSRGVLFSL